MSYTTRLIFGGPSVQEDKGGRPLAGRNERCPCGSGKKFKKCCAQAQAVVLPDEARRALSLHQGDQQLVDDMLRWARKKYGKEWFSEAADAYFDELEETELEDAELDGTGVELQLLLPWAVYHYEKDEKTLAQALLEDRRSRLPENVKGWLDAQAKSWLSVWEVLEVKPGEGVRVRDLLTTQERFVHEVKGSRTLRPRDAMLGRVVDFAGVSTFCGMHPRTLPPMAADVAVQNARLELEVEAGPVPVEKLRSTDDTLVLIDHWHACVEEADKPKPFPQLHNTDGDPFLLTKDYFDFEPEHRALVLKKLQGLEGAQELVEEDGQAEVPFTKPGNEKIKSWDSTLIGRAFVGQSRLTLETNSVPRADALRKGIEEGLADLVRHRLREHSDVEPLLKNLPPAKRQPEEPPPGAQAILRDFKEKHMAQWLDEHIPALDGLTPREAAGKPEARAKLDLLMRDIEHMEARLPEGERYDMNRLRETLGLSP